MVNALRAIKGINLTKMDSIQPVNLKQVIYFVPDKEERWFRAAVFKMLKTTWILDGN